MRFFFQTARRRSIWIAFLCVLTAGSVGVLAAITARAAEECPLISCLTGTCFSEESCQQDDKDKEPKCSYGPCDCQPRKTLLQWSYGTSFSGGAPSMDEPLQADRPGFTVSTVTVGKGVVQLESGYTYTIDNAGRVHQTEHEFPDTLWRIGMFAEWFEWRIEYNYEILNTTIDRAGLPPLQQHLSGSEDLILGCKIALTPQEGILPEMCLLPEMSVPSGAPGITEGLTLPELIWGYSWKLNDKLSVTGLTSVGKETDDLGFVFTEVDQAFLLQVEFTKKFQGFIEWYVLAPSGHTIEQTQHYSDGGFLYLVTNNIQLDAEVGVGLNAAANNFFAGTGVVVRF